MRLLRNALLTTVLAFGTTTSVVGATPADDDISLLIFLGQGVGVTKTAGLTFSIVTEVEGTTGVVRPVSVRLALPTGLRWGADAPGPADGCSGDATITCAKTMTRDGAGTARASWRWGVVAASTGPYEITGSASSDEPDPNAANNTSTLRFEVTQSTTGGGSGGGTGSGGSGTTAVSASTVKLSPAKPKAGSTLVAAVRVTRGGSPVKPTGITCTATVGKTKVKGGAKSSSGLASCLFKTPKAGRGKAMLGTVSFEAGGQSFTKRFSARLR